MWLVVETGGGGAVLVPSKNFLISFVSRGSLDMGCRSVSIYPVLVCLQ